MNNGWFCILNKINRFTFEKGIYSFINPYSFLLLENKMELSDKVDFWLVDGISLVNYLNKNLNLNISRHSFDETSLAPLIFNYAKQLNLKIAIIGTKKDVIDEAVANISSRHSINIEYSRNGYFNNSAEREECYSVIINRGIELVICGMGTPFQESFLIGLKEKGWNGYGFTCGGYLHQISKKVDYYPKFVDTYNLRWVYRIYDEPRLIKRYFFYYPLFFLKFGKFLRRLKK